jgi:hypothetical protein
LTQADGTTISLSYSSAWLPGGATLNPETGWLEWAPGYSQAGELRLPIRLTATATPADGGETVSTSVSRELVLNVLNANGAPQFEAAETWNLLEGQALRISAFAFDPDNPDFEPKLRLSLNGPATEGQGEPSVTYQIAGLPDGARFDPDTLELLWTPGYNQAGSYSVTVTATDNGDGTGTPATSQITLPIVVANANRAPEIGDVTNAFVDRGAVLEIPVSATDADGNPVSLSLHGLPSFASYTQSSPAQGGARAGVSGVIRFAPGDGHRGDYTITVAAQDNGDGDLNQVAAQAKSFVVSVRSPSEAPVVTVPRQSVVVAGQEIRIPIVVRDLDQDPLTYGAQGLPAGARIETDPQYGQATLRWTPGASQLGVHDMNLLVSDSGLPPQDAGYLSDPNQPLQPNTSAANLRIVVRAANAAPELIALSASGGSMVGDGLAGSLTTVKVDEGVPLTLEVAAREPDLDFVQWTVAGAQGLPPGMTVASAEASGGQSRLILRWTPGLFAAQGDNSGGINPGHYRLKVTAADGSAAASRDIDLVVGNLNQAPALLPVPLQLVQEGQTVAFTVQAADADNDATRLALIYDQTTPAGVSFNATNGAFEWTPGSDVVNNAAADSRTFDFQFSASDGKATTLRSAQVRVFDVNRAPEIFTANHALLVGQEFSLPVIKGTALAGTAAGGLRVSDSDGALQTQNLVVSFSNLPEGSRYEAQSGRLLWTPGPGQVGDRVILATVSDGKESRTESFTLRVVAETSANAPTILVNLTPSTPVLPGQTVVATVRAESFSPVNQLRVEIRQGSGADASWTPVALDSLGRLKLSPNAPGLVDLRVTAVDADGFQATQTQSLRVRDPQDLSAPRLAWAAELGGREGIAPLAISKATLLRAEIEERQLMGWELALAPLRDGASAGAWTTVAEMSTGAAAAAGVLDLGRLDPSVLANGPYQLRLRAWDLSGRAQEITAEVIIDSREKQLSQALVTDAVFQLGSHRVALSRDLPRQGDGAEDLGNWRLPLLDTRLRTDQEGASPLGAAAAWQEGARVWLEIPEDLARAGAGITSLRFTLGTRAEPLGSGAMAPVTLRPQFTADQGWSLTAVEAEGDQPVSLRRQGQRLYDQASDLPWIPQAWALTAPDGSRYSLEAAGKVEAIRFSDGQQWLVSDAGLVPVGATDPAERVEFVRDPQGRIVRISGPAAPSGQGEAEASALAYRYDEQGRLALARSLYGGSSEAAVGYHADGRLIQEPIAAYLGTAAQWQGSGAQARNSWRGTLTGAEPLNLSLFVRGSEIAATIKTPGAAGAVILAVETLGAATQLAAVGATVLGTALQGGRTITLLRTSEAGLKLLSLQGSGEVEVQVSVAGDLDRDGDVDGADSDAWEAAAKVGNTALADLDGNGSAETADRQLLYANYGWRANQAPVGQAQPDGPALSTHTDLTTKRSLASISADQEGDPIFWRVLSASHGSARLAGDGQMLLFSPEAGYSGNAAIVVQADDGFNASAPIELSVKVSGARLLAIHLQPLPDLLPGQSAVMRALGDFEDASQVDLGASGDYLHLETRDLSPLGYLGAHAIRVDDSQDRVRAETAGAGLIVASRTDAAGRTISATAAVNVGGLGEEQAQFIYGPEVDVYPNTLSLAPGGTRQLKVWTADANSGERIEIQTAQQIRRAAQAETSETFTDPDTGESFTLVFPATAQLSSGTRYISSDESVATISADGLITAKANGVATISVVHLGTDVDAYGSLTQQAIGQTLISLKVQLPQLTDNDPATSTPDRISVGAEGGGIVAAATGETVLIGPGALKVATAVGIQRLAVDNIEAITGLASPAEGVLLPVAAFRLDLGAEATNEPVQLRIPVQVGAGSAQPGEEVLFFRKGQVLQPDGQWHDTWWLLDPGGIEADASGQLVARTASRPYEGMTRSGDYMISRRSPGMMETFANINIEAGTWASFGGLGFSMGGGLGGFSAYSTVLGILASQATNLVAGRYAFGVPKFADIKLPHSGLNDNFKLDTGSVLPPVGSPLGDITRPYISSTEVSSEGQIVFTVQAPDPDQIEQNIQSLGQLVVRAVLADGKYRDILKLPGNTTGQIIVTAPDDLAIGSVRWQLVRLIPTDTIGGDGTLLDLGEPLEVESNQVWLAAKPGMAAVLTKTGITIVRQENDPTTIELLDLVKAPGKGQEDFAAYLAGRKVQPIAFSPDQSRIYVGGNGVIYVIDTLSLKRIETLVIPDGKNITSLATSGDLLLIGEGGYGGSNRLLAMNTDPGDSLYNMIFSIQNTGIEATPNGVGDITIGPDEKTMVVTIPNENPGFSNSNRGLTGDVLIFNLESLDLNASRIDAPVRVTVAADGIRGNGPQIVTATADPDHYLVANINDYGNGLSTLVVKRDEKGNPSSAVMNAIAMTQPDDKLIRDRLSIQRAQSAVLINGTDGTEYAVISDDNLNALDPYWRAMFEAPMFVQTSPSGPPTAVGGAASAKKVNVGGKLGIVKDPFGLRGAPEYLGATVPLDGYGIVNLSVSGDGKKLIGQLKGGYGTNDQSTPLPHLSQVWDVEALLAAAIAQPESDRLSNSIILPTDAGQLIPTNESWPAGTAASPVIITLLPPGITDSQSEFNRMASQDLKEIWPGKRDSRPIFNLMASQDLKELRIFISTFGPEQGLFPDDRPKHIASDWINEDQPALEKEHLERIFTSTNLIENGKVLEAYVVTPFDVFKEDVNLRLTPGQTYWWGAEGKMIEGGEVSAKASAEFTVKTAFEQGLAPASAVTIITHGFQPPIGKLDLSKTASAELARMIAGKQGGVAFKYLRNKGTWVKLDGENEDKFANDALQKALSQGKPVILVPDWMTESGFSDSGFSEAAADAIYASLVQADIQTQGKLLGGYLHLIAHSRGTVVNSELSQRLLWYKEVYGSSSPLDLHITTLDPHDQEQPSLIIDGGAKKFFTQVLGDNIWVSKPELGLSEIDYSQFYDPNVQAWAGVDYADNYYQHIASETLGSITNTPNGRSLAGADPLYVDNGFDFEFDLSGFKGFIKDDKFPIVDASTAISHSRPQSWYAGTIDLSLKAFSPDGKKKKGDPIIRRRADYAADSLPLLTIQSPYTMKEGPWYSQKIALKQRFVRGNADSPGLQVEAGDTWEGIGIGWAMSALGGGINYRIDQTDQKNLGKPLGFSKRVPLDMDHNNTEFGNKDVTIPTVFNGDFQSSVHPFFGRFPTSYELPGWAFHNVIPDSGSEKDQGRNLAFRGLDPKLEHEHDRERIKNAFKSASEQKIFYILLDLVKSFEGKNFTINDLDKWANFLRSTASQRPNIDQDIYNSPWAFNLLNALDNNNNAATNSEQFGYFGLQLGLLADWAFKLDATMPELRHNRMVMTNTADNLIFEICKLNLSPEDSTAKLVVELLGDGGVITSLGELLLKDLPNGFSPMSLAIPQEVRKNILQLTQILFRLEYKNKSTSVLIDNIKLGSSIPIPKISSDEIALQSNNSKSENIDSMISFALSERMAQPVQVDQSLALNNDIVEFFPDLNVIETADAIAPSVMSNNSFDAIPCDAITAESGIGFLAFWQSFDLLNSTLINTDFGEDGTRGWINGGDLQTGPNLIILNESTNEQTHLAQVFIINPGDRQLRFTIASFNLASNGNGPGDAFEVALLDADSLLPALGIAGTVPLADSDALLNIQPDGTTFRAPALQVSNNGDGSQTYVLDLPDSLAGSAVLLSFDLLGFAGIDSSVSLRDINLSNAMVVPAVPILTLTSDTGYSSTDRLTTNGNITVIGVDATATWQFSTDAGLTWSTTQSPSTTVFTVAEGSYGTGQVQVRQSDPSGNTSEANTSFEAFTVDGTAPIGSLQLLGADPVAPVRSSSADGTYGLGAVIHLSVELSEAVLVDTTAGSPTLQLETGGVDRFATYSGGSGTTTLAFTYIVAAGDRSADLDQLSSSALSANGATIQDLAGNNAIVTLAAPKAPGSLAANGNLVVDAFNDAPFDVVLSNVVTSLPETTDTNSAIQLADFSISDDEFGTNIVSLSGPDANDFELAGNSLYLNAGTALNFEGSQNSYELTLEVADPSVEGSTPIRKPYSLQIDNVNEAPNGLLLSTTNFDENIPINTLIATLSATDPDLPYTPQRFHYALTPNYGDNLIFYVQDNGLYISASPYYADYERFSSFAIRLQVSDQGGLSFQRDLKLMVNDLPDTPTYSVSQSASSILEGQSASFGLVTTNVPVQTPIYWSISGIGANATGITGSDFSDGLLSGSGSLGADGRFSLLRTTISDAQSDPDESFALSFFDDAARTHRLADPLVVQIREPNVGSPSDGADIITGTDAAETITGVPLGSVLYGRGSIDQLTGKGGNDIFVLGTASQRYYDLDGTTGMAVIKDFSIGQDKIQLNGMANQYSFSSGRVNNVTGTFISVASSGDRIGFIEGLRSTGVNPLNLNDFSQFRFVVSE